MPEEPALHPAYIVAIRPAVDGLKVDRGEFVLTVQTPNGPKNVSAPEIGEVELHVELMQDLEAGIPLFSIKRRAHGTCSALRK